MEAVISEEWNPAGFTCRKAGENIPLPNQLQCGTSPLGLSVLVNPREDRAPSTCGGQASQTHSWGSCISNSHFLCHFRVAWQIRGAGSLRALSFGRGDLSGSSVRGKYEKELGRTAVGKGSKLSTLSGPRLFPREGKKGKESCKYIVQRWNRPEGTGLGSG